MTTTQGTGTAAGHDFDQTWIDTFTRHHELISLLLVLIRSTEAGAHPVPVQQVADALGRTVAQTIDLFGRVADGGTAWAGAHVDNGQASFTFTADTANPRFRYHLGDRTVGVNGCAPDIFLVAYALRQPFWVESTCPATGTPIRVDFGADGVTAAEPATAVVAVIDPSTAPQAFTLTDPDQVDTDICLQQPFFASTQAAQAWLAAHPQGQAVPAAELHRRWRDYIAHTPASHAL